MLKKQCRKCKEWKILECFGKDKSRKSGKCFRCKECQNKYYQEHKEGLLKNAKKYYQKHKEKLIKKAKKYYQEHKKERSERDKKYNQEHNEERKKYNKEYRQEHKKERKKYNKEYQQEHNEELLEKAKKYYQEHKKETNQYQRNRRIIDPMYRLNSLMSSAIRKVKKNSSIKNGRSWKELVPYTLVQFKRHLKKTLPEGYSWNDFMQGKLHIDHILPKAIFQYEKPEDIAFQVCWSLENLRLLPAKKNIKKSSKLIKPFQKHFDIEVKIK